MLIRSRVILLLLNWLWLDLHDDEREQSLDCSVSISEMSEPEIA
ncbi:hypothetical protein [Chamaesiphon minutus]|nr:hypothetical protein [Chamaesiphon minutus]